MGKSSAGKNKRSALRITPNPYLPRHPVLIVPLLVEINQFLRMGIFIRQVINKPEI